MVGLFWQMLHRRGLGSSERAIVNWLASTASRGQANQSMQATQACKNTFFYFTDLSILCQGAYQSYALLKTGRC